VALHQDGDAEVLKVRLEANIVALLSYQNIRIGRLPGRPLHFEGHGAAPSGRGAGAGGLESRDLIGPPANGARTFRELEAFREFVGALEAPKLDL
jgi:hypothetical protein